MSPSSPTAPSGSTAATCPVPVMPLRLAVVEVESRSTTTRPTHHPCSSPLSAHTSSKGVTPSLETAVVEHSPRTASPTRPACQPSCVSQDVRPRATPWLEWSTVKSVGVPTPSTQSRQRSPTRSATCYVRVTRGSTVVRAAGWPCTKRRRLRALVFLGSFGHFGS